MNCEILETLYIRCNGDIPCNDDYGQGQILGKIKLEENWRIGEIFCNEQYRHIIDSLKNQRMPWPDICPHCAFYRPLDKFQNPIRERRISKIQVEPSLGCNLLCPECSRIGWIKQGMNPLSLDLGLYKKVFTNLKEEGFDVGSIEYCGQGEPLINRNFPRFVEIAREFYPDARQRLITNGNFDYWRATGGRWLNEIYVSCDGLFQKSYQKYRINGNVALALRFMEDAPRTIEGKRQALIWKYILFEFNDSDQEIFQAQTVAQEIGVDLLLFVFTHTRFKSQRFTNQNANAFPILFNNVLTNATPIHYQNIQRGYPVEPLRPQLAEGLLAMMDEVLVDVSKGEFRIHGWVLSRTQVSGVRILLDGQSMGNAVIGLSRRDVTAAYPDYGEGNRGYELRCPIKGTLSGRHEIMIEIFTGKLDGIRIKRLFDFESR